MNTTGYSSDNPQVSNFLSAILQGLAIYFCKAVVVGLILLTLVHLL